MNSRVLAIALALAMSVGLKADASQAMVDATIAMQIKEAKVLAKGIKHIRTKSCVRMKPSLTRIMDIIESLKPFEARARALYGNELLEVAATMKEAAEEMEKVKAFNQEEPAVVAQPAHPQPRAANIQTPVQMPAQVLIPAKQPQAVQNTPEKQAEVSVVADVASKAVKAVSAIQAVKTAVEAVQAAW